MITLRRAFDLDGRADVIRVRIFSDVHLGPKATDELTLARAIAEVAADPSMYWIGLGDIIDAVGVADRKRFSARSLAAWLTVADMDDIVGAQHRKAVETFKPIAGKCLAFLEGNHETAVAKYHERNVYKAIVSDLVAAGAPEDIGLGYCGNLLTTFRRGPKEGTSTIRWHLHHGYGGGKLLGGKALNLERLMASHPDCEIVAMGHVHAALHTTLPVYRLDREGNETLRTRHGLICGTFLRPSVPDSGPTYGEVFGYPPSPVAYPDLILRPGAERPADRIRAVMHYA